MIANEDLRKRKRHAIIKGALQAGAALALVYVGGRVLVKASQVLGDHLHGHQDELYDEFYPFKDRMVDNAQLMLERYGPDGPEGRLVF